MRSALLLVFMLAASPALAGMVYNDTFGTASTIASYRDQNGLYQMVQKLPMDLKLEQEAPSPGHDYPARGSAIVEATGTPILLSVHVRADGSTPAPREQLPYSQSEYAGRFTLAQPSTITWRALVDVSTDFANGSTPADQRDIYLSWNMQLLHDMTPVVQLWTPSGVGTYHQELTGVATLEPGTYEFDVSAGMQIGSEVAAAVSSSVDVYGTIAIHPTPEPSTLVLGLLGAAFVLWRRA